MITRTLREIAGTMTAVELAVEQERASGNGLVCNLGGGTHHAHSNFGSGFCLLNDLAVAAKHAQRVCSGVRKVLIFDLDVHQGDGTAAIFENDRTVFTCSFHGRRNFPFRKVQSDLDVALEDGVDDEGFMAEVERVLPALLDTVKPDLVLYDAGVDPHATDALGLLSLSTEGLYERDVYVLSECRRRRIPTVTVIGGGYDPDHKALGKRHTIIVQAAIDVHRQQRRQQQ